MKVSNMIGRSGRPVANQFIINDYDYESERNVSYFQSYDSIIAKIIYYPTKMVILDQTFWDYSRTTLKYLGCFLAGHMTKAEIQAKIDSGEYKLANLN